MTYKVYSSTYSGLQCQLIEIEAEISSGLPGFIIVGLGDVGIHESRERIRASIKHAGCQFPSQKKVVNLAPAEIRKQGAHFDLPIAISLLVSSQQLPGDKLQRSAFIGELSLSGELKPGAGILAMVEHLKSQGFDRVFLSKENAEEASYIPGIQVYGANNLKEIISYLRGEDRLKAAKSQSISGLSCFDYSTNPFASIEGMEATKRALTIAAVGKHSFLLSGEPGCGKTVICREFPKLLPPLTENQVLEISKIYSVSGQLDSSQPLILTRPFRELHHTASPISIIGGGGGHKPIPGEISLAHHGILFFDEINEFPRIVLEALRQPLEEKFINLNRSKFATKFPCNFCLIATSNPCPCGYFGSKEVECRCTEGQIRNYQRKLSGPILDRFDMTLKVPKTMMGDIFSKTNNTKSDLFPQILKTQQIQQERFKNDSSINSNSDMQIDHIRKYCQLSTQAKSLLDKAANQFKFSNRAYLKIIKISRSIADLDNAKTIDLAHISEAIQYRQA